MPSSLTDAQERRHRRDRRRRLDPDARLRSSTTPRRSGMLAGFPLTGTVTFSSSPRHRLHRAADRTRGADRRRRSAPSSSHPTCAAGDYAFNAQYIAGTDPNHNYSAVSSCEPFYDRQGHAELSTTLKNAATDATVADGSTCRLGSGIYDTATMTTPAASRSPAPSPSSSSPAPTAPAPPPLTRRIAVGVDVSVAPRTWRRRRLRLQRPVHRRRRPQPQRLRGQHLRALHDRARAPRPPSTTLMNAATDATVVDGATLRSARVSTTPRR